MNDLPGDNVTTWIPTDNFFLPFLSSSLSHCREYTLLGSTTQVHSNGGVAPPGWDPVKTASGRFTNNGSIVNHKAIHIVFS